MKVGDLVDLVTPPGLHLGDISDWKQQSPGVIVGVGHCGAARKPSYKILWNGGEITFEWSCYLEVISENR